MTPSEIVHKKILFSALNWGLGHVMRSIPLLELLVENKCTVFIACDEQQLPFFQEAMPNAIFLPKKGYPFSFSGKGLFSWDLLKTMPRLIQHLGYETRMAEQWTKEYNIDIVIADQCFGFRSSSVLSIVITHQVNLPITGIPKLAQHFYNKQLDKYDYIWIPDIKGSEALAGKLSQTERKNAVYIGWLSRFRALPNITKKYAKAAIISGPEPYNYDYFESIKTMFLAKNEPCFILFHQAKNETIGQLEIFQHLSNDELNIKLQECEVIYSRSGYSTLMDLKTLDVPSVLTPTPGQNEQIYLAKRWNDLNGT